MRGTPVGPRNRVSSTAISAGIGYAVVELNGVRHVCAAAVPRKAGDIVTETGDALRTIQAVIDEEGTRGSIVKQAVFFRDSADLDTCRQVIQRFYGPDLPATAYIHQAPCEGKRVAVEALGVGRGRDEVRIERYSPHLTVASHNDMAFVHVAGVAPSPAIGGVYAQSLQGFREMERYLQQAGAGFHQVIRTWLYLGDIVGPEGCTQRYKELNRARADYFRDLCFAAGECGNLARPGFPASTGIGACGQGVSMSCLALKTDRKDLKIVPLENPHQISAYEYAVVYSPESPRFSRAMALAAGQAATIFVSGTAAITASESRHHGDVAAQTHRTLENIEALIAEENVARHDLPGLGATLSDLALVRVYVKRREDYEAASAVCRERLGEVPIIFAVADVCRDELLVEIEAIAYRIYPGANRPHFAASDSGLTMRPHHRPRFRGG